MFPIGRKALIACIIVVIAALSLTGLAIAGILHTHTVQVTVSDAVDNVTPSTISLYRNQEVTTTFTVTTKEPMTLAISHDTTLAGLTKLEYPATVTCSPTGTFDVTIAAGPVAQSGTLNFRFSEVP